MGVISLDDDLQPCKVPGSISLFSIMNKTLKTIFLAIGIPTLYALTLRIVFGIDQWKEFLTVMSLSFLFIMPAVIGILTVYLSPYERTRSWIYRLLAPWTPVILFFMITLLTGQEGWACWMMIMPLFLVIASIGGIIGAYLKYRKTQNKLQVSGLVLLPLFFAPLESLIEKVPGTYTAYTSIDIQAPADKIWDEVTRVREIPQEQDNGYLTRWLGFPRPVKAELNYEGVGAYRQAIFTKGLVFHETVTEYQDNKKMVFNIKAYPHEIPSATMDEHVVIGGEYFDVLNGTYELEPLEGGMHRLHLYSRFKMKTTFNFYAGWWATWIMKDIQNNILQVEKLRAEKE